MPVCRLIDDLTLSEFADWSRFFLDRELMSKTGAEPEDVDINDRTAVRDVFGL